MSLLIVVMRMSSFTSKAWPFHQQSGDSTSASPISISRAQATSESARTAVSAPATARTCCSRHVLVASLSSTAASLVRGSTGRKASTNDFVWPLATAKWSRVAESKTNLNLLRRKTQSRPADLFANPFNDLMVLYDFLLVFSLLQRLKSDEPKI